MEVTTRYTIELVNTLASHVCINLNLYTTKTLTTTTTTPRMNFILLP